MNSTGTTPATSAGRQVGQLLAGRYRLAVSKGGDDIADVWHALDETTQKVVTLEILRDSNNEAARRRFLAEAQRMAAIERPSVMRVAAIHNEATDTFIVFEHLIPLPVVLTGLTAVAKDVRPPTKAVEDKTTVITPSAPQGPVPSAPSLLGASVRPETLPAASRSLTSARSDVRVVLDEVKLIGEDVRRVMRDARLDTLFASARDFVQKLRDTRAVSALVTRVTRGVGTFAQETTTRAARARDAARDTTKSHPGSGGGSASLSRTAMSVGVGALSTVAAVAGAVAPVAKSVVAGAVPYVGRARGNPAALAGATAGALLLVVVLSPLDDMLGDAFRSGAVPAPTAVPSGGLAPAPFEIPPLAAYGAAFDSQGAYPRTTPGGTVEWVVALRNTGSAGWYRGIEGAQAALALADGTGVAVQSTQYVAPGQVGWFVVRFRARAEPGTYTVQLLPRIDGRGPLPDLGIYAVVTVARNP